MHNPVSAFRSSVFESQKRLLAATTRTNSDFKKISIKHTYDKRVLQVGTGCKSGLKKSQTAASGSLYIGAGCGTAEIPQVSARLLHRVNGHFSYSGTLLFADIPGCPLKITHPVLGYKSTARDIVKQGLKEGLFS